MFNKLEMAVDRYQELNLQISDPDIINDQMQWQKLMREHSELQPIVEQYKEYINLKKGIDEAREMIRDETDEDMRELAKAELSELEEKMPNVEAKLKLLLLPKDPNDDKNVILEIRAGAGGDEAGLFASELLRLYIRFAERQGWKVEMMNTSESGVGGIKEASVMISGKGAYSKMKFESGIHRVQRVPQTESGGRIHTSTATVAVLPEVEDVEVVINPNDLRIDVFRSSGNGGQSVNTTDSAVRVTHLPTGMVVSCQDGKSQLSNKEKAIKVLKARLYEIEQEAQHSEIAEQRRSMVGSGDRSGKIRTYNFPQGRITDHRIGLTIYKLSSFMEGDIDEMLDALIADFQAEALKNMEGQ